MKVLVSLESAEMFFFLIYVQTNKRRSDKEPSDGVAAVLLCMLCGYIILVFGNNYSFFMC